MEGEKSFGYYPSGYEGKPDLGVEILNFLS